MQASPNISIIKANCLHLPAINAIEQQLISPWSQSQVHQELALPHGWQFVALLHNDTDEVIGYIFGSTCLDEAEIRKFAVSSLSRRRGVGRALLAHALHSLQANTIKTCFLELRESNRAALTLYSLFGFKRIGLRKSYYINPSEHAIMLKITFPMEEAVHEKY